MREEISGECVWNPGKQIHSTTGPDDVRSNVVRDSVLTCVVLHLMLRTH